MCVYFNSQSAQTKPKIVSGLLQRWPLAIKLGKKQIIWSKSETIPLIIYLDISCCLFWPSYCINSSQCISAYTTGTGVPLLHMRLLTTKRTFKVSSKVCGAELLSHPKGFLRSQNKGLGAQLWLEKFSLKDLQLFCWVILFKPHFYVLSFFRGTHKHPVSSAYLQAVNASRQ